MNRTWEFVIRIVIILNLHRSLDDAPIYEDITKLEILHGDFIAILKLHECFGGETPAATTPTAAALASLSSLGAAFFLLRKNAAAPEDDEQQHNSATTPTYIMVLLFTTHSYLL
jgi:hypothetical protein